MSSTHKGEKPPVASLDEGGGPTDDTSQRTGGPTSAPGATGGPTVATSKDPGGPTNPIQVEEVATPTGEGGPTGGTSKEPRRVKGGPLF